MSGGLLGAAGYRSLPSWCTPAYARARAAELVAAHQAARTEVVRNPHRNAEWAQAVVRAPRLLGAVQDLIGRDVAVENTLLVLKWPYQNCEVPWHQDGINDRVLLDPQGSVAAWLALTDAGRANGCLHVIPGSQRGGYLPYGPEPGTCVQRGRPMGARVAKDTWGVPMAVAAGSGLLMDVRLLHRSLANVSEKARLGLNIRYVAPGAVTMRDGSSPSLDPVSGTGWQSMKERRTGS
ncbi:phytanoyl-CoA dioxygenase family protein [Streptomyces sp. CC224B]|uniref:phytanoyl-CoA dioxygenase family protein n=1 Tax=Streptomyces sp. CC224B TaxID=3044571 RepID=UPI0024A8320A|nr:phytanoyl-CoA dioxygenase family protein [Streptomyces sp. CC224B]